MDTGSLFNENVNQPVTKTHTCCLGFHVAAHVVVHKTIRIKLQPE